MFRQLQLGLVALPLFTACVAEHELSPNVDGLEEVAFAEGGNLGVTRASLDGDIGPVAGLAGEGTSSAWDDGYGATIQVDNQSGDGTAFVLLMVRDFETLRSIAGRSETYTDTQYGDEVAAQGCSDTFDGEHYDATAEELTLTVEELNPNALEVEYEVRNPSGDLTQSPLPTTASGNFMLVRR